MAKFNDKRTGSVNKQSLLTPVLSFIFVIASHEAIYKTVLEIAS